MRIALVGSAPSSVELAPYDDPSWVIWACSPGAVSFLKRLDAFFEIHRWLPGHNGFEPGYMEWLAGLQCPVYMPEKQPEVPNSVEYPAEQILAKYPGFAQSFFTSSLSWMLVLAIEQGAEEIGVWGVDMAANEEYGLQKPGCHFFMLEAERRGIKVTVPPESDLHRPIPLYGIGETSHFQIKCAIRERELEARMAQKRAEAEAIDRAYQQNLRDQHFLAGAMDDNRYHKQTWGEPWQKPSLSQPSESPSSFTPAWPLDTSRISSLTGLPSNGYPAPASPTKASTSSPEPTAFPVIKSN